MAPSSDFMPGFNTNHWSELDRINKPLETHFKQWAKLGLGLDGRCMHDDSVQREVFQGPRVYADPLNDGSDRCKAVHYFNYNNVKDYLRSRGVDVERISCEVVMADHKLRLCLDHMQNLASLTSAYEDSDPTSFVAKVPKKSEMPVVENAGVEKSTYRAYESDFTITYTSPPVVDKYISASHPSFYHLYIAVVDAVQRVITKDANTRDAEFKYLQDACTQFELFTGYTNPCVGVVYDILMDYNTLGYVELADGYLESPPNTLQAVIELVVAVKKNMLRHVGLLRSDLGVSYSPGGFIIPFFLGFSDYLVELNIVNATTPLAGGSAGAITAMMSIVHTITRYEVLILVEKLFAFASEHGYLGTLDSLLVEAVERVALPETHNAANVRIGPVHIITTARVNDKHEPRIASYFNDNMDLITAIRASGNVPSFLTIGTVDFRGEGCYDGGLCTGPYYLGTLKAPGKRTLRFMPIAIGYGRKVRRNLQNDIANSLLQKKEKYFVHFIRLKSLLKQLLMRRLHYAQLGRLGDWKTEVEMCIAVYNALTGGHKAIRDASEVIELWLKSFSKEPGTKVEENPTTRDCTLADLFKRVVASELALKVGPGSKKHAGGFTKSLVGVNIIRKFTNPKYPIKNKDVQFLSTPYTLVEWLGHELSLLDKTSTSVSSTPVEQEIKLLRALLHNLAPPNSLNYYFTEFPYLILSPYSIMQNNLGGLRPCTAVNARHLYDAGRAVAFRWVLGEYISFENWLHLRIRQLEEDHTSSKLERRMQTAKEESRTEHGKMLHELQHQQLNETLEMINPKKIEVIKAGFTRRKGVKGLRLVLFKIQNRLVRRAISYGVVEPYYYNILGHRHFWVN